ncbi:hypothetical protein N7730_01210 [Burkholderia cenocepacia]|nr:hypothetical protein [Burkholderia cenocepacia]
MYARDLPKVQLRKEMNDVRINGVEQAIGVIATSERQLRDELLKRLVLPNLIYLRGGNSMQVGQSGWYSSQSTAAKPFSAPAFAQFSVPVDCGAWYDEETDERDGLIFRFFAKRAWLYLEPPARRCRLEFIAPFAILPEAFVDLRIWVGDIPMSLVRDEADRYGRTRFVADISQLVLAYLQMAERVRIDFECRITGVPALLYIGSNDQRRLSCAISRPRFVEI